MASVVILGGGIAGLTAAYELRQAGYNCQILEAMGAAGGRSLTLRHGDRVQEYNGEEQVCQFEEGLYFNAGPARIPSAHRTVLAYCKAFGVELEVFINDNRSTLFQDDLVFDGRAVSSRQVHHDTAGYISELLAKAINRQTLDEELASIDTERLLNFLRAYGGLRADYTYQGSDRIGYDELPGSFGQAGRKRLPLELRDLVNARFWHWKMHDEKSFEQQTTMFQPIGGMDKIVRAFEAHLRDHITYHARVTELRHTAQGVRVVYEDLKDGKLHARDADYCICTLPLTLLRDLRSDLGSDYVSAIRTAAYAPCVKLGWQASRRFWEEDEAIYGGISYIENPIAQIWYPCTAYHANSGVLLGAYNLYEDALEFAKLSAAKRAGYARMAGTKLHPQMEREVHHPISVAWHNMQFVRGAWVEWAPEQRVGAYTTLSKPDRRIYFAGEHMSWLQGWQEGAILSAREVVTKIHGRVLQSVP